MTIDMKSIRAEHERHSAHQLPGELTMAQLAAHAHRAQLLALVDRQAKLIRSAIMDCVCFGQHADDRSECEWCVEARDLLRDLDGDARGGGR